MALPSPCAIVSTIRVTPGALDMRVWPAVTFGKCYTFDYTLDMLRRPTGRERTPAPDDTRGNGLAAGGR